MAQAKRYWLLKTEPESYSIHDLAKEKNQTTFWSGVRNYQARNFMRDDMRVGDQVLIYHSNANPPHVAGVAKVVREGYPDHTSWDENDHHFDEKSTPQSPRWFMVDVRLARIYERPLGLDELRQLPALSSMELLRRGSRLSVQPVTKDEFQTIDRLGRKPAK